MRHLLAVTALTLLAGCAMPRRPSGLPPAEFESALPQLPAAERGPTIRRNPRKLDEGGALRRLLHYIHFQGGGRGRVQVRGSIAGRVARVTDVVLRFGLAGASPVTACIHDIGREEGRVVERNAVVARVDTLTFRREDGPPRMGVSLASLRSADGDQGWWADLKGAMAAKVANLVVKPLRVEALGHRAMLDFGRAIACQAPTFTFPKARVCWVLRAPQKVRRPPPVLAEVVPAPPGYRDAPDVVVHPGADVVDAEFGLAVLDGGLDVVARCQAGSPVRTPRRARRAWRRRGGR